jgi:arylsulfatase A
VPEPHGIVIFLADDLGYGDLSCYGSPINQTPNLDRFAAQGVRLTDCHSAGTVCSPSRAALLTGRNPYRSGFHYIAGGKSYLRNEEITIAEILREKNFQTGFFGKWHLSNLADSTKPDPGDQGFDYWLATSVNAFEGPENPQHFIRNGERTGTLTGWYCDILVRESIDWLKNLDPSKPFLLVICTHEPHTPVDPPDSLKTPFLNDETRVRMEKMNYGGVDRDGNYRIDSAAKYYGTIRQLDNAFGTLVDNLDQMGLIKNTLLFFTSDNGPEHPVNFEESRGEWYDPIRNDCYGTPGPFSGMKRYPLEGGHRVPGLARWPGVIPEGIVSNELFNGTDVLPLICHLAGADLPSDRKIDGDMALNAFLGKSFTRKEPELWIFPTHEDTYLRMPHMAMRQGNLSLTGYFPDKPAEMKLVPWMKQSVPVRFKLFDLNADPAQKNDISALQPDVTASLGDEMTRLWLDIRQEYETVMK